MTFSVSFPKNNSQTSKLLIAYGRFGPKVHSVCGRVISYTPTTLHYAYKMVQWGERSWRLYFKNLTVGEKYDFELMDQDGKLIYRAKDVMVVTVPAAISILEPGNNSKVCSDFMAAGTTTQPGTDIDCIKLVPASGADVVGTIDEYEDNFWTAEFSGVADGDYTLKVAHAQNCTGAAQAAIEVDADECNVPAPEPIDPSP